MTSPSRIESALDRSRFEGFHAAVQRWFATRFPGGPTSPQALAWPAIAAGRHTLVAAPTGSGKTLAAFLVAIDALWQAHAAGEDVSEATRVVYVSPLKALAVDVRENLVMPLEGIAAAGRALGHEPPSITAAVRSGDTSQSARQAMVRRPPSILVTTPESLYLYLTAARSRSTLRGVRTVIVDEIHATARDKRGAHLALTLERLEALCAAPPVRIGLSATQRPIGTIAALLVGERRDADGTPDCAIVDVGHVRAMELSIETPDDELSAVASADQVGAVLDRIAGHVGTHRTTLVFTNTRRQAERFAHELGHRLGPDAVAAHHGSLSKDRRERIEDRLRAGDLRALVATASLELGIDVGPVELVCQVGSPRSIATFLQRVGRSNHARDGVPKGFLYPLTRDELVECAALVGAARAGRLDAVLPPAAPLDVLAQQIVAEVAARDATSENDLFDLVRRAAPYGALSRADFDAVLDLVSDGIETGRGTRGAWLHRDRVHGLLRPRRGARLAALGSGGAIPDNADYKVVLEPEDAFLGSVNEDWAVESMPGDTFLLGTQTWRIRKIEPGVVRVVDAAGAPPSVPFWLGEAPSRTAELSVEVAALREEVDRALESDGTEAAVRAVQDRAPLDEGTARMLVAYLAAGRAALGGLPTRRRIVYERFHDETGGAQVVVHAPFGGRINRAFGLALRKRFCVGFDFELQAAANDDAILLSVGSNQGFPLEDLTRFLHSRTVCDVLAQATLGSPMFAARWRWNLNRSLVVLRTRGGRRNPYPFQRMEADDVLAAAFPALAQCQDNAPPGPIDISDHVIVRQTMQDCLHEAMDADGLRDLLLQVEAGEVEVRTVESAEPSVLAHEILNGRPYTFLDDAPLEERRSRAVVVRRGIPDEDLAGARLSPEAIAEVRAEAAPDARNPEELHDLLYSLVIARPMPRWQDAFRALQESGRAMAVSTAHGGFWSVRERRRCVATLVADAAFDPNLPALPGEGATEAEGACATAVRGHLEVAGPTTAAALAEATGLGSLAIESALAHLESEGAAVRGSFDPALAPGEQWCARRLLLRIVARTRRRARASVQPVSVAAHEAFVALWQHVAPGSQLHGRAGVAAIVEQLQGREFPAGEIEAELARRVEAYRPDWLDDLCLSGDVAWGRLTLRAGDDAADPPARGKATPSRATPIGLVLREDLPWLLPAMRGSERPVEPTSGPARQVLDALAARGALFHGELRTLVGRLPVELEEGLWDGVARGLVTADSFRAVRSLLSARDRSRRGRLREGSRGRRGGLREGAEGRWSRMPQGPADLDPHDLAESVAGQVVLRWGVAWRDIYLRERFAVPWRDVLWAFRRLEARGVVLGGRFVAGPTGEQFALPEAAAALARTSPTPRAAEI